MYCQRSLTLLASGVPLSFSSNVWISRSVLAVNFQHGKISKNDKSHFTFLPGSTVVVLVVVIDNFEPCPGSYQDLLLIKAEDSTW